MAKKSFSAGFKSSFKASSDGDGHSMHNEILAGLSKRECEAVFANLEFVEMRLRDVLNEMGETIKYCYFVNSGLASILNVMSDGKSVEVGLTGKEGFVGLPVVVGLNTSANRVVTQIAGAAFRISARLLADVLRQCPQLERMLNRYSQTLALQSTQVAACNRLHEVEERLARWLLMSQDRIGGDAVPFTQDFLAHLFGTPRARVTVVAGIVQKTGLITFALAAVKIVKRV